MATTIFVLLLVACGGGLADERNDPVVSVPTTEPTPLPTIDFNIDLSFGEEYPVGDLQAAFADNEENAISIFGGRNITAVGVINEIKRDLRTDEAYVEIQRDVPYNLDGVRCFVSPTDEESLADLEPGMDLKVTGRFHSLGIFGSFEVRPCRINTEASVATAVDSTVPHVSVGDLLDEFEANSIGAERKYSGQNIAVGGEVDKTARNSDLKPYVEIGDPRSSGTRNVACFVDESEELSAASLLWKTDIVVSGTFSRHSIDVELDPCEIVSGTKIPPGSISLDGPISADDLGPEFLFTPLRAEYQYRGQELTITGEVKFIEKFLGYAVVLDALLGGFKCNVADEDELRGLQVGDEIEITGRLAPSYSSSIQLEPCRVTG